MSSMIDIRSSYPENIESHSVNYYVCGKGRNDLWSGLDKPFEGISSRCFASVTDRRNREVPRPVPFWGTTDD